MESIFRFIRNQTIGRRWRCYDDCNHNLTNAHRYHKRVIDVVEAISHRPEQLDENGFGHCAKKALSGMGLTEAEIQELTDGSILYNIYEHYCWSNEVFKETFGPPC